MGFLIKWLFGGKSKKAPPVESVRNVLPREERHAYKTAERSTVKDRNEDNDEDEKPDTASPPLAAIARDAWRLHRDALKQEKTSVLRESMPVLYFGNEIGYRASKQRVVTVGLNPSHDEFPDNEAFRRFRIALPIGNEPSFYRRYFKALNNYFVEDPCPWFHAFVPLLEGLDASYYPNANHRVIHTDLCSALATNPAWSGLSADERRYLQRDGVPLWHRLINELRPHLILTSLGQEHLERIELQKLCEWERVETVRRRSGEAFEIKYCRIRVGDDAETILVHGDGMRGRPFATLDKKSKRELGKLVAGRFLAQN